MPERPNRRLPRAFFNRPTLAVARDLLGTYLVRLDSGRRLVGVIVETEAYCGDADLACHARAGRTPRTAVMYGPPGHAYVYFTYGQHWMLNFVTEPEGQPAAVLVRAIQPTEGLDLIAARRAGQPRARWTDGPAKLCQALGITGDLNGADLIHSQARLFVLPGMRLPDSQVQASPRVGIDSVPEPWKSLPWRFRAAKGEY